MQRVATAPDGVPIAFEVHGEGSPALVFVHGWSCDRSYWRGQMPFFARRHRVVAVDLAGHGESGDGRADWTMPAFGDDVVAVADDLDLTDMVLVGHSMGGDVIVDTALAARGRVRGLVWADVYGSLGEPRTLEEIEGVIAPLREDFVAGTRDLVRRLSEGSPDPDLAEWIAADMSSAPPEVAMDALRHAISNEPAVIAGLAELGLPCVAINPESRARGVASLARHGVRTKLMSGVGHFLMLDDPDGFNRLLAEVIEELSVAAGPGCPPARPPGP